MFHAVGAVAQEIQCLSYVETSESTKSAPNEWNVFNRDEPHYLMAVEFYDGNPEKMASLTPDDEGGSGKNEFAIWRFPANDGNQWIACDYRNTSVFLSKKLDRNITECKVEYEREPGQTSPGEIKKITCSSSEDMMK